MWPKPLPNHWVLGSTIGVGVDSRDHIFIIHRGDSTLNQRTEVGADAKPPLGECCRSAPPILEFDPDGNLVKAWGGPGEGYTWPGSNHGITIDDKDNVWIGGNGDHDSHIIKFSHDGKFLAQYGSAETGTTTHTSSSSRTTASSSRSTVYLGGSRTATTRRTSDA